jgi:PAS domain S-box-containing protein
MLIFWGPELITFYNDAFRVMMGDEGDNVVLPGRGGEDNWPEAWPLISPMLESVIAGGEPLWIENQQLPLFCNNTVAYGYWNYSLSPVADDTGAVNGILLTCCETTKAVETTDQLRISEQRFQNLIREASMGIIMLSGPEMRVEIVNEAYAGLLDRQVSELLGKKLFDVIPEARDPFHGLIDEVRSTGQPLQLHAQPYSVHVREGIRDGFLDLIYQPYKELDGEITGVIILCQDVTQQVSARRKLEESESRLRSLVESAPFPIGVYVGPEMRIQLVNQSIIDVWGKGPDVIGKRYADVLPELAGKGIYEQLDEVYRTGKPYYAHNQRVDLMIEGRLQRFYFKYTFTPLLDGQGKVYGVMNTAADVTDLVLAKEQLQEVEVSLRGAVELAQLGSWELDIMTGQVSYSATIQAWFGFGQDQLALPEVINPIHPQDQEQVEAAIRQALAPGSSGIYDAEYRLVGHNSMPERIIHARGKVIYNADGQAYKLVGTAQDVTAEREYQQALEQLVELRTRELAEVNEELAANNEEYMAVNEELEEANQLLMRSNENLQQFAYVAGHDLQEPLRKIQQFGDLFRSKYAAAGLEMSYLERMQSAANRMSTLIRDLLDFSSISTQHDITQIVPLNAVVETVLNDLELIIAETGASVKVNALPVVEGNELQLGQLFQNLLSNALKFRQPNLPPVIQIISGEVSINEIPMSIRPSRVSDRYHQIEVIDNGIGFDEKYLDRIFQVFQRLHGKSEFTGTGIGLAICEKVVNNHGGAITAISTPGQGAVFRIYLPA